MEVQSPAFFLMRIAAFAVLSLTSGACQSGQQETSPFELWDYRPGMPFEVLQEASARPPDNPFVCRNVVRAARLCETRTLGVPGRMRVLVDSLDRVAVIQFRPDTASPLMREAGRRFAAEWNVINPGVPDESVDTTTHTTRWHTADHRWTAMVRYGRHGNTPEAIDLGDRMALAGVVASTPLTGFVLALNGILDSIAAPLSERLTNALASVMYRRAADLRMATTPPQPAASAAPLCLPVLPDLIERGGRRREEFGSARASMLEQGIAKAYPGSRLIWGDGTWIIDSTGRSERVNLDAVDFDSDEDDIAVFALNFPSRIALANERIKERNPANFCRAPLEVLFARSTLGAVVEVHRIPVDLEALASYATLLEIVPRSFNGEPPHVRVRYTSIYGSDRWWGSLEFETVIADDPPQSTARVLLQFAQENFGDKGSSAGPIILTGRHAGGVELTTLEKHDWGYSTRSIVVPVDSLGVLLGVQTLARLF
jgi:hypothetical protein